MNDQVSETLTWHTYLGKVRPCPAYRDTHPILWSAEKNRDFTVNKMGTVVCGRNELESKKEI